MRPDWTIAQYDNSSILDLSTNVCFDKNINYNLDFSKYTDAASCYQILSKFYEVSPYNISIGYGLSELILRILLVIKKLNLSITIYDQNNTWKAVEGYKNVLDIPSGNDVLYIANPNGNDGKAFTKKEILDITKDFNLVILDEAYCDYKEHFSFIRDNIDKFIVCKTMSKSLPLPGLRFGWAIANKYITEQIQLLRPAQVCVGGLAQQLDSMLNEIPLHVKRMQETKFFIESNYETIPSNANYVLLKENYFSNLLSKKVGNFYRMALLDKESFFEYTRS